MARDPALQKIIDDAKTKKFRDGEAKGLVATIGDEIKKQLAPLFSDHSKEMTSKTADAVVSALKGLTIEIPKQDAPQITVPEVKIPDIKVPTPVVNVPAPVVNVPAPIVNFPKEMGLRQGNKPFPVIMVDPAGKPMSFSQGASGGKGDFFTIVGIQNTILAVNSDPAGIAYSTTNPLPVTITSGASATSAVNIVDSSGVGYSGSNPVPVSGSVSISGATGSLAAVLLDASGSDWQPFVYGQGDAATAQRVVIAGNADASVVVNSGTITTVTTLTGVTNSIQATLIDSSGVGYSGSNPVPVVFGASATQGVMWVDSTGVAYEGANPAPVTGTVVVSSVTASVASALIDSGGVQYSTSNPFPIGDAGGSLTVDGTVAVSSVSGTTAVNLSDSSGVGYSGSNPVPITWVSGAGVSTVVNISDSSGVGYSGSNPVPITIVSGAPQTTKAVYTRRTNPTAVAADYVPAGADDLGRQLVRPIQVRDLIATAYVSKATGSTFGTETTLLAATAGFFYDLIYVLGTNDSSASINCDIRGITAGNVLLTLTIPSGGTAGVALPVPLPQTTSDTGNAWTIDLPDVTGTNVTVSALFTKEV